ncbi:MAG: diacylglycerol kinase family protein [Bacilli bacterium]
MLKKEDLKNCVIIYNPISTGFKENDLNLIASTVKGKGYNVDFAKSMYSGHVIDLIKQADAKNTLIITLGGDGTVGEVYKGLSQIKQKGIYSHVPTGTTNDMAKNFNIINKEPDLVVRDILDGNIKQFDTYTVNGVPAAYCSVFGYCAHVPYITTPALKKCFGHGGYVIAAMKDFLKGPEQYNITYSDTTTTGNDDFILGAVSNSLGFAGINLYKNAKLDDGLIELLLVKKVNISTIAKVFKDFLNNRVDLEKLNDIIVSKQASKISLTFNDEFPNYPFDIDGDKANVFPTKENPTVDFMVGKKIKVLIRK